MSDLDLGMKLMEAALATGADADLCAWADWLADHEPTDELQYALKWCVRRKARPRVYEHGRWVCWYGPRLGRNKAPHVLPRLVYGELKGGRRFPCSRVYQGPRALLLAYRGLAAALRGLREACEAD